MLAPRLEAPGDCTSPRPHNTHRLLLLAKLLRRPLPQILVSISPRPNHRRAYRNSGNTEAALFTLAPNLMRDLHQV